VMPLGFCAFVKLASLASLVAGDSKRAAADLFLAGREKALWERCATMKRGTEFLGGRLAAKLCAGLYRESRGLPRRPWAEVEIYPRGDGRPFCRHADGLSHPVSISHSGGWAAALVSCSAAGVGIDIEASSFRARALPEMFGPPELSQLAGGEGARRRWTLKETYGKLTGRGVLGHPRDFVTLENEGRLWLALARREANPGAVFLASAEKGRLSISVAFACGG
jgi:4'-phosphopantetheinyl transferase superfamily/4'-phosphopantetheinyl transferase N-terminal domain